MKQQVVFPEVSHEPEGRLGSCPHCGAAVLRRHQSRPHRLVDLKVQQVKTVQYRCAGCGGFVTVRPAGVPVIGADETEVKLPGQGVTVGFLTDAASGQIMGIELLSSRAGKQLSRWLAQAAQRVGAQVVVTDHLASYKVATEAAGLDHQLCLAHGRKAVALRLLTLDLRENSGRLTLYQQATDQPAR